MWKAIYRLDGESPWCQKGAPEQLGSIEPTLGRCCVLVNSASATLCRYDRGETRPDTQCGHQHARFEPERSKRVLLLVIALLLGLARYGGHPSQELARLGEPSAAASEASVWRRMAERVGFEPTCRLRDKTLSRRPRYDHFGTSP